MPPLVRITGIHGSGASAISARPDRIADAIQKRINVNEPRTYGRCFILQGRRCEACFVVQPKLAAPCQSAANVDWLGNGGSAAFVDFFKELPCLR